MGPQQVKAKVKANGMLALSEVGSQLGLNKGQVLYALIKGAKRLSESSLAEAFLESLAP